MVSGVALFCLSIDLNVRREMFHDFSTMEFLWNKVTVLFPDGATLTAPSSRLFVSPCIYNVLYLQCIVPTMYNNVYLKGIKFRDLRDFWQFSRNSVPAKNFKTTKLRN